MSELADAAERRRILSDLDSTFLVEAAAGTGKTALLAGRIAMLLVAGVDPGGIAAITFTEAAAAELASRVRRYIDELIDGRVPTPMRPALPQGLSEAQRRVLGAAARRLGELTTATIHGFCQNVVSSFAVEAGFDPGATVMDAPRMEAMIDATFERWLTRRLSSGARPDDPIAHMARHDPRGTPASLSKLMRLRLAHRAATAAMPDRASRPDIILVEAARDLQHRVTLRPPDDAWLSIGRDADTLASFYEDALATQPCFARLWSLAHPPRLACMRNGGAELLRPRSSAAGRPPDPERAAAIRKEAEQAFDRMDEAYRAMLGRVSVELVATVSGEMDELLEEYAGAKRAASVVDFDDIIELARSIVRTNEAARRSLGERFRNVLVDEHQDTDPRQAETLFRIASDDAPPRWQDCAIRPGGLFLVGDPKQAVYAFRGADVDCYRETREAIARRGHVIAVGVNFRSAAGIVAHVNDRFAEPLSRPGQAGYAALVPSIAAAAAPSVVRLPLRIGVSARSNETRDAEAEAVADACAALVGRAMVRIEGGAFRAVTPADIVLLTPTLTEIPRYERALEERGFAVASRAGKSFFARQETQDLVALVRAIADPWDTLALGALLRGPLVGLDEGELLDIAAELPTPEDTRTMPGLSGRTPPETIAHPLASRTLSILQDLRRRAWSTTPSQVLGEAVERLLVRPALRVREGDRAERALANVDLLLERASAYDVSGLQAFARDVHRDWQAGTAQEEGRCDPGSGAIEIATMHGAKGLEWPIVIPINAVTGFPRIEPLVHRPSDDTIHWRIGEVTPPDLQESLAEAERRSALERERLWYVACTRARDLLVLPTTTSAASRSWAGAVDLGHASLPDLDLRLAPAPRSEASGQSENRQDAAAFSGEQSRIQAATPAVHWDRPSDADRDRITMPDASGDDVVVGDVQLAVIGGRIRGLLLHKLIEEVLTGEIEETVEGVRDRAAMLLLELHAQLDCPERPDPAEAADTVMRTLGMAEVRALRPTLVAELPVHARLASPAGLRLVAGRMDAIGADAEGRAVVVDWKSDVAPDGRTKIGHRSQMEEYMRSTGIKRGAIVYMTSNVVEWVERARTEPR